MEWCELASEPELGPLEFLAFSAASSRASRESAGSVGEEGGDRDLRGGKGIRHVAYVIYVLNYTLQINNIYCTIQLLIKRNGGSTFYDPLYDNL